MTHDEWLAKYTARGTAREAQECRWAVLSAIARDCVRRGKAARAAVVASWDALPLAVRERIVELVLSSS